MGMPARPYCRSLHVSEESRKKRRILHERDGKGIIKTYIGGVVEAEVLIQPAHRLELPLLQVPSRDLQILLQPALVVALRDDGDAALRGPAQQDLRGRLAVRLGDLLDDRVVEEELRGVCALHLELAEGLRAEGGVGGHGDVVGFAELDEGFLGEVGVVLKAS